MTRYAIGGVTTEHTIWCATARNVSDGLPFRSLALLQRVQPKAITRCESHHQCAGSVQQATAEAKALGWVRTPDFGWLCRACHVAYVQWGRQGWP